MRPIVGIYLIGAKLQSNIYPRIEHHVFDRAIEMEASVLVQFISLENLKYLATKIDVSKKDLESFIDNHKHEIKLNKSFWSNIRTLNKKFLRLKAFAKPTPKSESLRSQFLSGENVKYLAEVSKWDIKNIITSATEFASNDLQEMIEAGETIDINIINQEFLSGMSFAIGNPYEEEEAYHDNAFKNDSLGVKHGLNEVDGKFHTGPVNQDGYEGNKVNRFEYYSKQRQPKVPFYQNLSHRRTDYEDVNLGQGYTDWEQPAKKQLFYK